MTAPGFPCHTLYKAMISALSPARVYTAFSGGERYGPGKRLLSHALYGFFFLNDLFGSGYQLFVHARPRG